MARSASDTNSPPFLPLDSNLTPDQKWAQGIQLPASAEDIDNYIQWRTLVYREKNWTNQRLSLYYSEDFEDFDSETFKLAKRDTQRELRDLLREKGVYVSVTRFTSIADNLVAAMKEELHWPADDPQNPNQSNPIIQSRPASPTLPQSPAQRVQTPTPIRPEQGRRLQQLTPVTGQPRRTPYVEPAVAFDPIAPEPIRQNTPNRPDQEGGGFPGPRPVNCLRNEAATSNPFQPHPFQQNPFQPIDPQQRRRGIPLSRYETPPGRHETQQYEPEPQSQPQTDYSRQIANLTKMYTDEDRYSGQSNDSFDYKIEIFLDNCKRAGLPHDAIGLAFPIMLAGLAKDYYYRTCRKYKDIDRICDAIRKRFETDEQGRSNLFDWDTIKLDDIVEKNPDKSTTQCLDILIRDMSALQRNLPSDYHSDRILRDKLLNACRDNEACRFACYKASSTLMGVINDLQSSIKTFEKPKRPGTYTTDTNPIPDPFSGGTDDTDELDTYYTDRKYQGPPRRPPNFRPRYQRPPPHQGRPRPPRDQAKKCFVCHKYGCWSTNHSPAERQEAAAKIKQRFDKKYDQYIAEFDAGPDDDDDDLEGVFEALIMDDMKDQPDKTPDSATYFMACGEVSPDQAREIVDTLANQITEYALTQPNITDPTIYITDRYSDAQFAGVMVDTGAARISTAGKRQYHAYIKTFGPTQLDTSETASVRFGVGDAHSIGSIRVDMPIGTAKFHVVDADTPFLLCLQDMDKMGVYYNNISDRIVHPGGSYPIVRRFSHPFVVWDAQTAIAYLTEPELRQLHRRFGHPAVERLATVLNRAGYDDPKHHGLLQKITDYCSFCQKHGQSPRRFKFTLRSDSVAFNHTIYADVLYIDNSPVLHVVDEATRFQAARWLDNMTAQHTWDVLRTCWIDTYLGPPDLIVHDAGTNFTAQEFKQNAHVLHIRTKVVPTEAAQSMGIVERYHHPLRRAYNVISDELNLSINTVNKSLILQMAVKAINDTAGPDGLVPTLLVFGTYPRLSESDPPSPNITQRAIAVRKAMQELVKLRARRQITDALGQRNGPKVERLHDLAIGSDVLVWRVHDKAWTGPYRLLSIEGEDVTVEVNSRPTRFRTTAVKPYLEEPVDPTDDLIGDVQPDRPIADPTSDPTIVVQLEPTNQGALEPKPKRGRGRPRKYPRGDANLANQDPEPANIALTRTPFEESRRKELDGLFDHGVFEVVDRTDLPPDSQIFGSRFVDEIKFAGTEKAYEKSRLVVQGYNDAGKREILTQAPTIQRASQRILLGLAPSTKSMKLYLRDISQAYTQSTTRLARNVFIKPPAELSLPNSKLLRVVQPLYGIAEAGTHWFNTYHKHHIDKLNMVNSTFDPCLLIEASTPAKGVIGMQTDDTLILATAELASIEQAELCFPSKPRQELTITDPIQFNGARIRLEAAGSIVLTQSRQISKIELVKTADDYIAQRARGAYIATVSQPERAFGYSFAAQVSGSPTADQIDFLNKQLAWQLDHPDRGLRFVPLDLSTLRVAVFTDSSFANNVDMSSQIGYIVVTVDKNSAANIVHWGSIKCRRVTRSVLAAELYAMSLGFDYATVIRSTIQQILGRLIELTIYIDSKSLYDCLVRLGSTTEKRLMVDIMCLRQSYERREISQVVWINREYNIADAMTKDKPCASFKALIDSNRLNIAEGTIGWVKRKED
jgi:hypothetical protein